MLAQAPMVAPYTIPPTFGGMGAALKHLAHLMELSTAQNMETACRYEKAQCESHAHIARERGDLDATKSEQAQINGERLPQCARDQVSEFQDRRFGQNHRVQTTGKTRNRARGVVG